MLDIQGRKYASVTVCDVTLYDLVTKYPVMYFDTLKVTTLEGTAEVTDIQGGQGNATLASVSHSKAINVQFDDAIMTMSSLAVLTGGELAAMTVIDAVVRLLPGVLGQADSHIQDSFSTGLLEHPHYTRPADFRGMKVPDVLLSGNHAKIEEWREEQSFRRTYTRRPDLFDVYELSPKQQQLLEKIKKEM